MKIIYAMIPMCLLSSCQKSTPPAEGPGASTKEQAATEKMTAQKNTDDQEVKPEKPAAKPSQGDDRFIGMARADAEALAEKESVPFRVVSVDGKVGMVTMDHRPERLNFTVVDGKITKVTRG